MSDTLFCTLTLSAHVFFSHVLYEFNRVIKPYDVMSNVSVVKCVIFIDINSSLFLEIQRYNSEIVNLTFILFMPVF